jgi:proline dehydrogenase
MMRNKNYSHFLLTLFNKNIPLMTLFDNLETAFRINTDSEIRKAKFLFSMLKYPWLVKTGKVMLQVALFIHFPVRALLKRNIFSHFCGGETRQECEPTVVRLNRFHVKTILDYSAEGGESEAELDAVAAEITALIEYSAQNPAIPFAVFKPTGIVRLGLLQKIAEGAVLSVAEQEEFERARKRFIALCDLSASLQLPLFVDAEESWIQKPIDDLLLEMMRKHNRQLALIFNTLQMYRTDRLDFLAALTETASKEQFFVGLKLVRGAYMEKERERALKMGYPSPILGSKAETDASYNKAVEYCFEHSDIISVCNASHNELSCALLVELIEANHMDRSDVRFWFAQLYGMSNHISFNLAEKGFNVCKYLPYGPVKAVMPYLIRRAEENTSLAGQTGRELQMIAQEQLRRKSDFRSKKSE